jgi:MoaA/NifB/PqqE/SkfB family radical SAM enzyme
MVVGAMFEQTVRAVDIFRQNFFPYFTRRPARTTFEITRRCNLSCPNCYVYTLNPLYQGLDRQKIHKDVSASERSLQDYDRVFREEKRQGRRGVLLIGGEPTLRMDVIQSAYKYFGRNLSVVTNGLIKIPGEMAFPLVVSMDGSQAIHDRIRGNNTWQRVHANYIDDHRVILSCCLRKGTVDQIQPIIDDWVDSGVFGASFFFITPRKGDLSVYITGDERERARKELHRVVDEYPHFVRMTHQLVELLCDEKTRKCPISLVSSWYDYQGTIVRHCLLGIDADCEHCGCVPPLYINMIKKWWRYLDRRTIDILTLPRDARPCRRPGER